MANKKLIFKHKLRIDGLGYVLCENCDNRASKELSEKLGWYARGARACGEADALNDFPDWFTLYVFRLADEVL